MNLKAVQTLIVLINIHLDILRVNNKIQMEVNQDKNNFIKTNHKKIKFANLVNNVAIKKVGNVNDSI